MHDNLNPRFRNAEDQQDGGDRDRSACQIFRQQMLSDADKPEFGQRYGDRRQLGDEQDRCDGRDDDEFPCHGAPHAIT